jgi:hypothetical protein
MAFGHDTCAVFNSRRLHAKPRNLLRLQLSQDEQGARFPSIRWPTARVVGWATINARAEIVFVDVHDTLVQSACRVVSSGAIAKMARPQ